MIKDEEVKWVIVEDGHVFEGSIEQFRECFFDDFSIDGAIEMAANEGWKKIVFLKDPPQPPPVQEVEP